MSFSKVKLYCNGETEDKKALYLLMKAEIPYVNLGPTSEESSPFLEYGHWKFSGIQGIRKFIVRWQTNNLPPLDLF